MIKSSDLKIVFFEVIIACDGFKYLSKYGSPAGAKMAPSFMSKFQVNRDCR